MHIDVHVEGEADRAALENILAHLVPTGTTLRFMTYSGKRRLLEKLPIRLQGCAHSLPSDQRILVLVDHDDDDCRGIKDQLAQAAENAGLVTKTVAGTGVFDVLIRIAVEELEAWFLGDMQAMQTAYPGVRRAAHKPPDEIRTGTWEEAERMLREAGHCGAAGMPKIEVARKVSRHMDPERNTSHSFQVFVQGVQALVASVSG